MLMRSCSFITAATFGMGALPKDECMPLSLAPDCNQPVPVVVESDVMSFGDADELSFPAIFPLGETGLALDPCVEELQPPAAPTSAPLVVQAPVNTVSLTSDGGVIFSDGRKFSQCELSALIKDKLGASDIQLYSVQQDGTLNQIGSFKSAEIEKNYWALWGGIGACLLASATMSGLTLGLFSLSRMNLEILSKQGNESASKILGLRDDSNTLLATLVWGNVGVNVVLTLLSDQALAGAAGLVFSIGALTILGDILPQSLFARHALKLGSALAPVVQAVKVALYPVAKPSGMLMDAIVGKEGIEFFKERDLKDLLRLHAAQPDGDISKVEALGSINFLTLDDLPVSQKGQLVDPESVIQLPFVDGKPVLPDFKACPSDPLLKSIQESGKKWVIFCSEDGKPELVLDANAFLRDVLFEPETPLPEVYWHKPIVVTDPALKVGELLTQLRVRAEHHEDDVIDDDLVLVWTQEEKRIITGSDLLGRLLRGIVKVEPRHVDSPTRNP